MSISWVLFWPHRLLSPTKPQTLAEPFDEPGGEHHEHQLGIVLATPPPKPY